MLRDKAGYYYTNEDCNCAEAIIRAANDVYDLGINDAGLRAFGGFGGGVGCKHLCGAAAACVGALGARYIETVSHQSKKMKGKNAKVITEFQKTFGSEMCACIVPEFQDKKTKCLGVVQTAADILEKLM